MLESPDISESEIFGSLQRDFGLEVTEVEVLPLGVDPNAAVYRITVGESDKDFLLKLRSGPLVETAVLLLEHLSQQGIDSILAPYPARSGQLWGSLTNYRTILFPFVRGRNGYEMAMSDQNWIELGRALRLVHDTPLPAGLRDQILAETFDPQARNSVRNLFTGKLNETFAEPVAAEMAAFLQEKREQVLKLVEDAEHFASIVSGKSPEFVICHSDIHAGNVMIGDDDRLYIVDWDDAVLAPRERDLMYAGGAQGFSGHTPQQEEALFYYGYNDGREPVEVDIDALAYYRLERIIQDIDAYCHEILLTYEGDDDRAQGFEYLKSNFQSGGTIEAAYRTIEGDSDDW